MELDLKEKIDRHAGRSRHRGAESRLSPNGAAAKRRHWRKPVLPAGPQRAADPANKAPDSEAELLEARGILELHPKRYGFLRDAKTDCRSTPGDVFVPADLIAGYGLRMGNLVEGLARKGRQNGPQLVQILDVDGCPADEYARVPDFDSLTPVNPDSWLDLETGPEPVSTRVIDLLIPLGRGQRGLIVAPPRTGKTVLLEQIGQAVAANHPQVKLMVLLVDERPEEVTEMRRRIPGQVFASSLDQDIDSHVRLSRLVVQRCKRLAERGQDVLLLVDSLTRMARAFNKSIGNSGRTMSGGLDIKALDMPKKLFASARAFEEGGSLTIMATALIETGSRMDDLIFEEFKGTGNLELVLDRRLADQRVWPAIDIARSGTRREEKLLPPAHLHAANLLRRTLSSMNPVEAMQRLTTQLAKSRSNRQFIEVISRHSPLDE
jgi:transcription termination factor Rho